MQSVQHSSGDAVCTPTIPPSPVISVSASGLWKNSTQSDGGSGGERGGGGTGGGGDGVGWTGGGEEGGGGGGGGLNGIGDDIGGGEVALRMYEVRSVLALVVSVPPFSQHDVPCWTNPVHSALL